MHMNVLRALSLHFAFSIWKFVLPPGQDQLKATVGSTGKILDFLSKKKAQNFDTNGRSVETHRLA
jgi:hypothetical protein